MEKFKPTIRQLEYFIAVADFGHFRRAADRLSVSQPTLTSQIAALESSLNQQLFERSRHGTKISVQGRQLLPQARRVVEEMSALVQQASTQESGFDSTYTLGVSGTLGPYYLPFVVPKMSKVHDSLRLYIRERSPNDLEEGLLQGKLDFIIAPQVLRINEVTVMPLFEEEVKLVVPTNHPLACYDSIEMSALAHEQVLSLDRNHPLHHQVNALCNLANAQVLHDFEGSSLDALRQMVIMGMGIAFLPDLYILSELHKPDELKVIRLSDYKMSRRHLVAWRKTSPNRNLFKQFTEELKTITQEKLGHVVSVFY